MDSFIESFNKIYNDNPILINHISFVNNYNFGLINIPKYPYTHHYTKYLIFRNKSFEIYIIKWCKGSETNLHKHPKNGCILHVLSGNITEKIMDHEYNIRTNIYNKGSTSYINDNIGQHKIIANEDSLTLHIYSPHKFYD